MARGVFTIVELFRQSGQTSPTEGERFEWTSDIAPKDKDRGGARSAPLKPWIIGIQLRSQRTDYPGAKRPTEQVLGPIFAPFTLSGNFRDKYNFPGYALEESQRLEALVRRGNLCRIAWYEGDERETKIPVAQSFECLITNVNFVYRRSYDIGYEVTVSNHGRSGEKDFRDRSPKTALSPTDLTKEAETVGEALASEHLQSPPRNVFKTNILATVDDDYNSVQTSLTATIATIEQRDTQPDLKPVDAFRRIATQFRTVQSQSVAAILTLAPLRADTDIGTNSALRLLEFEDWTRAMRTNYRIMILSTLQSAELLDERADPRAFALYRAKEGESLYAVSNRFYGTPHAWRFIADRNNLDDVILTGDELLIIPERGGG